MSKITSRTFRIFFSGMIISLFIITASFMSFRAIVKYSVKERFIEDSNRRIDVIDIALDIKFQKTFEDINTFSKDDIIREASDNISTYYQYEETTQMKPSHGTEEERAIYEKFKLYGENHVGIEYVYLATEYGGYLTWPETDIVKNYDPRLRPWYQSGILANGEIVQTEPYVDLVTNKMIISNLRSFKDNSGHVRGVVGIDINLREMSEILNKVALESHERYLIVHKSGLILSDTANHENDMTMICDSIPVCSGFEEDIKEPILLKIDDQRVYAFSRELTTFGWKVFSISDADILEGNAKSLMNKYLIGALITFTAIFSVIYTILYLTLYNKRLQNIVENRTFDLKKSLDELGEKERNLRISENNYINLVNNIPGIVFRCEVGEPWNMLTMSKEVYTITGYNSELFIKDSENKIFWNSLIHREDIQKVRDVQGENETGVYEIEYRINDINGKLKWVLEKGRMISDPLQGDFIDGVIYDITNRIENEEKLKKIYEEMEVIIEERTEKLKNAMEQIVEQEKLKTITSLVSGVAHEINTPLGVSITVGSHIRSQLNDFKKDFMYNKLSKKNLLDYLDNSDEAMNILEHNLKRAANLVDNFKKISVSQMTGDKSYSKLKDILLINFLSLKHLFKSESFTYEINCPSDLEIYSSQGSWSQLISNLIINSFTHGFKGRDYGNITVEVDYDNNENSILMLFKDNGIGIEEYNINRIFEPFYTTDRAGGGSGLGLFVVYNIVYQEFGGSISLKSDVLNGTIFEFRIPVETNIQERK